MSNRRIEKLVHVTLLLAFFLATLEGCGVRGKPEPPLTPPELGRGQPMFKRATEDLAFPNVPPPGATPIRKRKTDGDVN